MSGTTENNTIQEREIPSVANGKKGKVSKGRIFGGVAIVAIAALIGYVGLTGDKGAKKKEEPLLNINKGRGLDIASGDRISPPPPAPLPKEEPKKEEPKEPKEDDMSILARRAPVIAVRGTARPGASQQQAGGNRNNPAFSGGGSDGPLQNKLKATVLEGVTATNLQNLHMVVPQGTPIPCTLDTAISSDQPGFVTCTTPQDVMSASGQITLMEKGTQVFGEYQSGVERGQGRIFVLWSTARTPMGVKIDLNSPATDAVGRAGMAGKIDTHFWERFGSAMLMSVVSDVGQLTNTYLAGRMQNSGNSSGNTTNNYSPPSSVNSGLKDAAGIAVENSINIKPTLYKNQGEIVSIMVARDLDFSNVYKLRRTETTTQIYDRTVTGDMMPARRNSK